MKLEKKSYIYFFCPKVEEFVFSYFLIIRLYALIVKLIQIVKKHRELAVEALVNLLPSWDLPCLFSQTALLTLLNYSFSIQAYMCSHKIYFLCMLLQRALSNFLFNKDEIILHTTHGTPSHVPTSGIQQYVPEWNTDSGNR